MRATQSILLTLKSCIDNVHHLSSCLFEQPSLIYTVMLKFEHEAMVPWLLPGTLQQSLATSLPQAPPAYQWLGLAC